MGAPNSSARRVHLPTLDQRAPAWRRTRLRLGGFPVNATPRPETRHGHLQRFDQSERKGRSAPKGCGGIPDDALPWFSATADHGTNGEYNGAGEGHADLGNRNASVLPKSEK